MASGTREEQLAPYFAAGGAALALLVTSRTLAGFAHVLGGRVVPLGAWPFAAFVAGEVLLAWAVLARRTWTDRLRATGLVLGASVLFAVLLWPILLLHGFAPVTVGTAVGCLAGISALVFAVFWLFVGYLRLPRILCAAWVVYRLILLALIVRL